MRDVSLLVDESSRKLKGGGVEGRLEKETEVQTRQREAARRFSFLVNK